MTVYTTLPTDDLNLAVTVIDDPDLVVLNITPASINLTGAVNSVNGATGTVVLDSDDIPEGTTNLYSDQPNSTTSDVTFNTMTADMFGVQHFTAKNVEGDQIDKGQPVFIYGHSGNTPEVREADSAVTSEMPAFGIASADIANNNNGSIATFGDLKNIDTTGSTEGETWAVGDTLYVGNSRLTNVRPSSSTQQIQAVAKIIRVHANNGQLFLMGAGRSNDTPNLANKNVFIGNAGGVEKRQLDYTTDILNTPTLPADQTLAFTTPNISISNGNTKDLSPLIAGLISASSTDTLTNKSGNISMFTNDANYSTTTGTVTPSSTDVFTNKSGNISMWTNDSAYLTSSALTPYSTTAQVSALPVSTFTNDAGYLTSETDSQTLSFATPTLTITGGNNVNLSALTTGFITASSTDALTNKSGNISQWTNDAGYSTTSGTVTSVIAGTGLTGGTITASGTIAIDSTVATLSGAQALTNKTGAISQWTNDANYSTTTGTVTPTSSDTFTNKSGAISQWTNDSGYLTAETDSQTLSFTSPNLSISNGNTEDLSALTDGGTY